MICLGFFFCQTSQFSSGEAARYSNIILPQNFHQLTPCSIIWGDFEGEGSATPARIWMLGMDKIWWESFSV